MWEELKLLNLTGTEIIKSHKNCQEKINSILHKENETF